MKIVVFSALTMICLGVACTAKKENNSNWKAYGPEKVDSTKAISMADLETQMKGVEGEKSFTLRGSISEVCSKAGCWITVKKADGSTMRVVFKDHFTIPPKTKLGTEAFIHGVAYWDSIPVELLRHYAEDANKSEKEIASIETKFELNFEADGITFQQEK